MSEVIAELRGKNAKCRDIHHQNNKSLHIALLTMGYLKHEKNELMPQSLYSSTLATNDYFLFSFIKNKMHGQLLTILVLRDYKCHVSEVPLSEWYKLVHSNVKVYQC